MVMDLNPELILGLSDTENGMGLVALPALLARALPCIRWQVFRAWGRAWHAL